MTSELPLGREVAVPAAYAPEQLVAIPRVQSRAELGIADELPFYGEDIWNCWEFGWLDPDGRPCAGVLELRVPADSPNLFESKSCKLYLFSWLNHRATHAEVAQRIAADLSAVAGAAVQVSLRKLAEVAAVSASSGASLDAERVGLPVGGPDPDGLRGSPAPGRLLTLYSDLFVSRCPVTGQPDWATVRIEFAGVDVYRPALLSYLLSYRDHQAFHESCCERIWMDLSRQLQPESLQVEMRFLRRGGIDINPVRGSGRFLAENPRLARQ